MKACYALVRLLSVLAVAGLVLAPPGAAWPGAMPAAAMAAHAMTAHDMTAHDVTCPPASDCDQACACLTGCPVPSFQQVGPTLATGVQRVAIAAALLPADDARRASLAAAPIPTPPRA